MPIQPTVFKNGVSTTASGKNLLTWFPYPDPTLFHQFWDDFTSFTLADWAQNSTGAATIATTVERGGVIRLTNTAGANDQHTIQGQQVNFSFDVTDKRVFMTTRLNTADYLNQDIFFGFAPLGLTVTTAAERFGFRLPASNEIRFESISGGTGFTSDVLASSVDGEILKLGAMLDANDELWLYVNDRRVFKGPLTTKPTGALAMTLFQENLIASAGVLDTDYFLFAEER